MATATTDINLHEVRVPSRIIEKAMVILWFVVTFTVFKNDEFILYPLAIYFFYAFFRDRNHTVPILIQCWPLLLLPLWALVTSTFAVVPHIALRTAIQLILTVQIAVLFAVWLRPREIILTVLAATGICGVLSVFISGEHDGAMTGIFAHKNVLGAQMLLLWSTALCVALDAWMRIYVRVVAIALAALALFLILASQSATALVLAMIILLLITGFGFFAGRGRQSTVDRFALGLILFGTLAIVIPVLVAGNTQSLVDGFLATLGKNSSLTGRTDLWAYAEDTIAERPWIGHGAGGFWRYDENDLVRQIFAEFHKNPNHVFSFHNGFYEVAVHFGLIGLGLTLMTLAWVLFRLFKQMQLRGGMPFIFFPTVALVELIRAYVESILMKPFVITSTLIWIGAVFASRYPSRR